VTSEPLLERLGQLEAAVRRATETITRLREENARLAAERRQVLSHVDTILKDLARLDEKG
jgi:predicted nuclease with TOPRIM domain